MRRLAAAAASAVGLLVLLAGAPWALAAWGRAGDLAGIDWAHAFTVRDDGHLLLGVLSAVGWLAWVVLAIAIVVEVVEVVDRLRAERSHRPHRLMSVPGLDLPRLLVRGLVVSVVTTVLSLALPRAQAPAVAQAPLTPGAVSVTDRVVSSEIQPVRASVAPSSPVGARITQKPLPASTLHVVRPYEDLRGLAATYYGDASQWQRIAEANSDLLKGQAVLRTGWRLVIPGVPSPDGTGVVVVVRGDSLSKLAARYLGDGDRWPEIYALNRDVVADANAIDIGWRLRVPGAAPSQPATDPVGGGTTSAAGATDPTPAPERPPVDLSAHEDVPVVREAPVGEERSAPTTPPPSAPDVADDARESLSVSQALAMGIVGTVAAGMASAVVRTIHRRRDLQLAMRPVGRRIPYPSSDGMRAEAALTLVGLPAASPLVPQRSVEHEAVLETRVLARRGIADAPWALVTAGFASDGPVMLDLEAHRVTTIDLDDVQAAWGAASAWALELACTDGASLDDPVGGGATVVAVGEPGKALASAGIDRIVWLPSVESALAEVAATAHQQREQLTARHGELADARADADARDAWWPRVYVFGALDDAQTQRLEQALFTGIGTAVSAVVVRSDADTLRMGRGARLYGSCNLAVLSPDNVSVRPVALSDDGRSAVLELLSTSGSTETTPAPWLALDDVSDNVLPLHPRPTATKEVVDVGDDTPGVTDFSHPTLMLLGPIQLVGAAGAPPARAERSCIEYCAWMVEHPGATAGQMAAALMVAETTRRSNVSRLRGWLGTMDDGRPYLPEAYTGRLYLDATVSSDWQRLQTLVSPGINRVAVGTLVSALKLVRGAPLADAAPGQWLWAEELRIDMASLIRDIGARVGEVALADGDIDLARWATSRALTANPGDELLVRLRLRTEHRAGNRPEVERLVLQLTRHARMLGIDLDDETVLAIQEAIEGQPRARA